MGATVFTTVGKRNVELVKRLGANVAIKVFRLDEVRDALAYSESGRATGKVVIKVV